MKRPSDGWSSLLVFLVTMLVLFVISRCVGT